MRTEYAENPQGDIGLVSHLTKQDDGAPALMGPADMDGVSHPGPGGGDGFGGKTPSLAGYDGFGTRIRRRLMVLGQVTLTAVSAKSRELFHGDVHQLGPVCSVLVE